MFRIRHRYVLTFLGFIGFCFNYCLRVNINLIITSMVKKENATETEQEDLFDWDSKIRNDVISTFFYGYVVLQMPGGRLAELFGAKWVLGIAMGVTAALTLLIPEAAKLGGYEASDYPYYLVAIRVLMGICEGATFPALTSMMARWAPLSERSSMTTLIMAGSQVGTIFGFFVSGLLIDWVGWEATFYIQGGSTFVWLALWLVFVFDSPDTHPFISEEEKSYIKSQTQTQKVSPQIPLKSIFTSLPFYAIMVANFSNNWGFHLLMTELPQYLTEVFPDFMKDSTTTGLWTAIPYASMWVCGVAFSFICDLFIRKNIFSIGTSRKIFNTLSQTGPGICLLVLAIAPSNQNKMLELTLALFTIAVSMMGALYSGWITNPQDIAPNFAGTIMGFTNCVGSIPGFVAPKIAGELVNADPTDPNNWRPVWIITLCLQGVASLIYIVLASGEVQPWNNVKSVDSEDKKKEEKSNVV